MATGTAAIRPPNEDSPPCHTAMMSAGWAVYSDRWDRTCMARAPRMAATMTHTNIPVTHCHG